MQVRGVDGLLDLAGGHLRLGLAGRRDRGLREEALLRALKTQRALLVLDDWHALSAAAQQDLGRLVAAFPPNVRVLVTSRGGTGSAALERLRQAFPSGLVVEVCGLGSGTAQRVFYLHMMRYRGRPWGCAGSCA